MATRKPSKKKRASKNSIWVISSVVAVVFMVFALWMVKMLLSEDTQRRKRNVQMVMLKPPPPPKMKEEPPPPEMEKKEEIIEPEPEEAPPEDMNEMAEDDTPPIDDLLGLDADGGAGMDGFGLKAKKGGRSLIGGGNGTRFAWYTAMIQKAISEQVREYLDANGGIPEGNLKAYVKIKIDTAGRIVFSRIIRSSGNKRMDDAVERSMAMVTIREMPPMDMPKVLKFRIRSQG